MPLFVPPVRLDVFVCLVAAAALATAFVRPAAFLLLELVLMHHALFVPPELSMKLLHPDPSIPVFLAPRVPTASQAAQLPAAQEYAPLGATRYQEVEKAHRARRAPQVHTASKGAGCRKAMACARKALSRVLAVAKTNAVRCVTPAHFLRLTEPLNARLVTHLPIFSRPEGHHPASIFNAGKLVPIKLQLVPIAAATALPAIAISSVLYWTKKLKESAKPKNLLPLASHATQGCCCSAQLSPVPCLFQLLNPRPILLARIS